MVILILIFILFFGFILQEVSFSIVRKRDAYSHRCRSSWWLLVGKYNYTYACKYVCNITLYVSIHLILITTLMKQMLFFFLIIIYLFLAVLGLCFCARAFSSRGKRGPLFIAVRGPLIIAASLVAEHRLQTRRLSSCGSRA